MKISANWMIHCPACGGLMIIANPTKQTNLSETHQIIQKCGDCKRTIKLYIEVRLVMWEAKEAV